MTGDPRDRTTYGIVLASLGLALSVLTAGICWVATQQAADSTHVTFEACETAGRCISKIEVLSQPTSVADGLWIALALLGGALAGALVPLLPPTRSLDGSARTCGWLWYPAFALAALVAVLCVDPASTRIILGAAFGGLLLGFLIPSPAGEE